jgi:adenine C2-methylase RlmN of 23S rRNA A2503 and tRNA A37
MGLHAQLSGAEILEQVFLAREALALQTAEAEMAAVALSSLTGLTARPSPELLSAGVRNVVFMGMGEPLDNYGAVHEALRGMTHQVRRGAWHFL